MVGTNLGCLGSDDWLKLPRLSGLSELFLVGGCVKKVGGCDELKTERKGGLHARFLHLN